MDSGMVETDAPPDLRLGDGALPRELDHANYGAFLLAVLWAPIHRLWGWFAVFVALEALESVIGLNANFLGGVFEQPLGMVVFRTIYWGLTVAFALQANRLVWAEHGRRAVRAPEGARPRPLTARYVGNQRIWTIVGVGLLVAGPLSLLVPAVGGLPGALGDVVTTTGAQVILLVALFAWNRVRARRRAQGV